MNDQFYVIYFSGIVSLETPDDFARLKDETAELWAGPFPREKAQCWMRDVPLTDPGWNYGGQPLFGLSRAEYEAIVAAQEGIEPPAGFNAA
jgi:hypothetical protein